MKIINDKKGNEQNKFNASFNALNLK